MFDHLRRLFGFGPKDEGLDELLKQRTVRRRDVNHATWRRLVAQNRRVKQPWHTRQRLNARAKSRARWAEARS